MTGLYPKQVCFQKGYIAFVPLSGKLSLELEFKDMKQTQYVDKTSLTLNPFKIRLKNSFMWLKRLGKDDLSPIFAKSTSLHNHHFENILFIEPKCGTKLNVCDETRELFVLNSKESYFEGIII